MNDFGQALQTASPFLLGLGAQLQGRDPNGISSGLAQMQEEAEKARRKSAIADLMGQMGIGGSKAALLDMLPFEAQAQMLMQEQQRMEGASELDSLYGALYGGYSDGGGASGGYGGGVSYSDVSAPNMGGIASGPLNPTPSEANYVAPEDIGEPQFIPPEVKAGIFAGESGGDYNALFGYSNRTGKRFAGVKLTDMTVDQALQFANPGGEYGQWVKGQVGHVATPMGAYQIVGSTLRAAKEGLGLSGNEKMTEALQDRIAGWIYKTQGVGAWEGYKGPRRPADTRPASNDDNVTRRALLQGMRSNDPGVRAFAQMEYEKRFGAQEPVKGVAVGGRLVNPYSGEVIFDGGGEQDMPAQVRELQWRAQQAGLEPGTEPYRQFMLAGGAQKGMSLTVGPNGEIRFTQGGVQSGETTVGQAYNPGEARGTVDLIDEILTDPNLSRVTGPIEGGGGNDVEEFGMARRTYYGSGGIALIEKVNQLQSRAWLAARDMLKGGGPITDYESRKAEGAVARLSRAKSDAEFKAALTDLRDAITEGMAKLEAAQGGGQTGDGWTEIDGVRIREKR